MEIKLVFTVRVYVDSSALDTLPYSLSVTVCLSEHNGSSTKFEDIILQGEVLSRKIVL